ncbi:methylthioribulose 1-phosphate dehydratase [Luteimonas sp. FXH3W]|uniref:Methylthioribulose-1-phosphate dehydratase n=1 Tax=Aquilutibacter rugosus TaxID=3115820 RepID=A0ABU7V1Q2_9GAMM
MTDQLPYDYKRFSHSAGEIIVNVRELSDLGWTPATSSNFSERIDANHIAITVSGRNKGRLTENEIMVIDLDGNPVETDADKKSSAETLLHTMLYRRFDDVQCVLHTHSVNQTVASRFFAAQGYVRLEGYELLKAFAGQATHETMIDVPVFPNTQDMTSLAAQVNAQLDKGPMWGYLIDGHGLYAWGRSMNEARRHLEAFETLLTCELEMRKLQK